MRVRLNVTAAEGAGAPVQRSEARRLLPAWHRSLFAILSMALESVMHARMHAKWQRQHAGHLRVLHQGQPAVAATLNGAEC